MVYTWLYAHLLRIVAAALHGKHGGRSVSSDLLAGCVCGCLTCWVVNPFWVIKIRLAERQRHSSSTGKGVDSQAKRRRGGNAGVIGLMKNMYRNEGGVRAFYVGVFASMCGCVEGAVQFLLVEQSKLLLRQSDHGLGAIAGETVGDMAVFMLLGSLARLIGVSLCYPYQVVRSRMQMSKASNGSVGSTSILGAVQRILDEDGVAGLYAGLSAKLIREAVYGGALHSIYEGVLRLL